MRSVDTSLILSISSLSVRALFPFPKAQFRTMKLGTLWHNIVMLIQKEENCSKIFRHFMQTRPNKTDRLHLSENVSIQALLRVKQLWGCWWKQYTNTADSRNNFDYALLSCRAYLRKPVHEVELVPIFCLSFLQITLCISEFQFKGNSETLILK